MRREEVKTLKDTNKIRHINTFVFGIVWDACSNSTSRVQIYPRATSYKIEQTIVTDTWRAESVIRERPYVVSAASAASADLVCRPRVVCLSRCSHQMDLSGIGILLNFIYYLIRT